MKTKSPSTAPQKNTAAVPPPPVRESGITFEHLSALERAVNGFTAFADGIKAQLGELISRTGDDNEVLNDQLNALFWNFDHSFDLVQKNADAHVSALFVARRDEDESAARQRATSPAPTTKAAPEAAFDAEKLFKMATCGDVPCHSWCAKQPGIRLSAPGLLSEVTLSEPQALNFVCETFSNWEQEIMRMTFLQWPEHRQRVADTLLLIESALSRAGCNWVVEKIKDTGHIATDAQIFAAICNAVETFEQLEAVFAVRDRTEETRRAERDVREARQQTPASAKPAVAA